MKEIEVKILEINPEIVERKILSLGGKKTGSGLMNEKFYDFPDGKLKSDYSILRLRTREKKTTLTFKHATKKMRDSFLAVREELEVGVSNERNTSKIISSLGLVLVKEREKRRTSFVLGKTSIEIDTYPGVPPYLEVEGNKNTIPNTVKKLGYTMKDTTNITSTKVLKKYGKNSDFLKF
jgi:adenylate cyclase class 2